VARKKQTKMPNQKISPHSVSVNCVMKTTLAARTSTIPDKHFERLIYALPIEVKNTKTNLVSTKSEL
jgi:hypothetical protein